MQERTFEVTVAGERVPGVLWLPDDARGGRPLVLMGHGRSQHKRVDAFLNRAGRYVSRYGWAVAAVDAPGHGDRISAGEAIATAAALRRRLVERRRPDAAAAALSAKRAAIAVPEWRAALDALQALDVVGADGPVGYWGVSMGTWIGVPLLAAEPRIRAAVLGLAGLLPGDDALPAAAAGITVPIEFLLQSDDEIVDRDAGLALFDAFASREKSLHLNPGGHLATPSFEGESWERFFVRHLGTAA